MKKIILTVLLLTFPVPAFAGNTGIKSRADNSYLNSAASKNAFAVLQNKLNRQLKIRWNSKNSTPSFIGGGLTESGYALSADKSSDGVRFLSENKELFGLNQPEKELKTASSFNDKLGATHIKYQQQINGIKIYQGQLIVHISKNGSIESVNGRYYPTPSVNLVPAIDKSSAILSAKNSLKNYREEKQSAELCLYEKNGLLNLTYEVSLPNFSYPEMKVFVDASSGEIVKIDNGIRYDGPVTGTGTRLNGTSQSISTYLLNGQYYLVDTSLPMFVEPIDSLKGVIDTYDANNDTSGNGYLSAALITDPNNDNNFNDNERLKAAVDAHIFSKDIYNFFKNRFNRNSFDDNGGTIMNVVHYQENYNNAFWNGMFLTYGDGDNQTFSSLAGAFDVITHEFTHGVTSHTADLIYENQSGALNESISDVFASIADSANWLIGEDVYTPSIAGDALRNMQDPHNGAAYGDLGGGWQPATMDEFVNLPNDDDNDNGGVHINSGIPNKAFYNVASSIGRNKAGKIWYRSLTVYLTNNAQFVDLRNACLASAKDLYGDGSAEYNAVSSGFDAVGITDGGSTGQATELAYDDNSPDTGVYEETAGWQLAVRFTPPAANSTVSAVKIMITGENNLSGNGSFSLVMYNADGTDGLPGSAIISPYAYTPYQTGWQEFSTTDITVSDDFYVGLSYDGVNQPLVGADPPPGNGRAYEFNAGNNAWYQLTSPDDYSIFIRAVITTVTGVIEITSEVPAKFEIEQNYPNPFNPGTTIKYSIPENELVKLNVYDITGRKVAELVNNQQNAGVYEVTWNGKADSGNQVASGIYLYTIQAGSVFQTRKMILLK